MIKKVIFLLFLLALAGCARTLEVNSSVDNSPVIHPPLPAPIISPIIKQDTFKVITPEVTTFWNLQVEEGDKSPYVYYGLNSQDYLTFSQYFIDLSRYIKELLVTICSYREEEKEKICLALSPPETPE